MSGSAAALPLSGSETSGFSFTPENLDKAGQIVARYPAGHQASAVLPLLQLAQEQNHHWLPPAALDYVADYLAMPRMRVHEVASFYSMLNTRPVGRWHLQVCTTTPCWLRGSEGVMHVCRRKLGIEPGQTTPDGQFTLSEVECLGACVNAPVIQVNEDYHEDLDEAKTEALIERLQNDKAD